MKDFDLIAYQQYMADVSDMDALKKANRVVFYDTDATVTQFYAKMYLGQTSDGIEKFVDASRYDAVFLFTPDVTWVAD
jgi:HTH-type transcriptional repressor of NAD biosynthesis genes